MMLIRKAIPTALFVVALISSSAFSQVSDPIDSINNQLIQAAKQIMISTETCALITVDKDGRPRVRAMDPFHPEDDMTVWFGTNPNSRKVQQIKDDPRVTLYYLDKDASGYVMIHGTAQLVNDQIEKERRWKAEWKAFYPNQIEDYLLIKVIPEWMEIISETHGILGDPESWKPPVVTFNLK